VKKSSGGFGASKVGRFSAPRESCESTPSASAYDADGGMSIGARSQKTASRAALVHNIKKGAGGSTAGFGSTAKRGSAINGQSNDAPGPGAYADGVSRVRSSFTPQPKRVGKSSSFGSTPQHELGAFTPATPTPGPGAFNAATGVGSVYALHRAHNFGSGKRFVPEAEVVQADYDVGGGAFAGKSGGGSRAHNVGFGGREQRSAPISGQKSAAPGPGAYAYAAPGAFKSTPSAPSSAFASGSAQHASNPSDTNVESGPSPSAYNTATYDPYAAKSFSSAAVLGKQGSGAFGSSAVRSAAKTPGSATPGPGAYNTSKPGRSQPAAASAFASASGQRPKSQLPSYADDFAYVPEGVGSIKPTGAINKGFGGADRGLLENSEAAEMAELRALLGR